MKPILDFLKYNNAALLLFIGALLLAGSVFASNSQLVQNFLPAGRPATPSPSQSAKPVDVSALSATDISQYDFAFRIDALTEDSQAYFVTYSYKTLEVAGGAWHEVRKSGKMDIFKEILGARDFEAYLTEQIGQVIEKESRYLAQAQAAINNKEVAAKEPSKYALLVGQEVTPVPNVEQSSDQEKDTVPGDKGTETETAVQNPLSEAELRQMIVDAVALFLAVDTSMPELSPGSDAPPVRTLPEENAPSDTAADSSEASAAPAL